MESFRPGEVVLLSFPFTDSAATKRRPAVILMDTGDEDIVVARVTGHATQSDFDVRLLDWERAGLRMPSVLRIHKVATVGKRLVERRLGVLAPADWARVLERLQQLWLPLWGS